MQLGSAPHLAIFHVGDDDGPVIGALFGVACDEAVVQEAGKHYVYVINNGHLKRTEVQTAISSLTRIQVVKGLQDNQEVALGSVNSQPLADGAPVKVVQQ